jgi:hypothetical protein
LSAAGEVKTRRGFLFGFFTLDDDLVVERLQLHAKLLKKNPMDQAPVGPVP